ncbi:NADH:flavin oxidoreductase/NADH oxidase [Homoserinimonas sp. A520]
MEPTHKNSGARLFKPLKVGTVVFPNRLWVSPMCQYRAVEGLVQSWHLVHLGALAIGRPGLILAESTAVAPEGRITAACAGIWDGASQAAWEPSIAFAHEQGVPIGIQLSHAGRKASTRIPGEGRGTVGVPEGGWTTVGPSRVAYGGLAAPRMMDTDDIAKVVLAFADAARRAEDVGFDFVEVHAAHGYLIHQFLSPLSNRRTDAYGGRLQGRARLLFAILEAMRAAVSAPIFLRLSATDWVPGGVEIEDIIALVPELEARGVDLFDISTGGNDPAQVISVGPGYQLPFARRVKQAAKVPVTGVGMLTAPMQMEQVLADGDVDAVFVAREFLRDRLLPLKAAQDLGEGGRWPAPFDRAQFR